MIQDHQAEDYQLVSKALQLLASQGESAFNPGQVADQLELELGQLTQVLKRWSGLTPQAFLQTQRLDYARQLLRDSASVLDTAYELGLSGPSRLHDLFVQYEAMPPGIYRAKGEGIELTYGWGDCPFGRALVTHSPYGLAALAFADPGEETATEADVKQRWPRAQFVRDDPRAAQSLRRIFNPKLWHPDHPLKVTLIGTDFQVRVWSMLGKIGVGQFSNYGKIAEKIGQPKASRAVGAAVGRNPLAFIVPCHRVIGGSGQLTGYHWGLLRKRAIIGWEAGLLRQED